MFKVDLNSDLGESFGNYTIGMDEKVIPFISSANVACGFHASDPVVMNKTLRIAKENNVMVGAHPGFPDLMGFGRRNMVVSKEEAYNYTLYQIAALDGFCKVNGLKMQHVKPHGAMYNMAAKDYDLAYAIASAVKDFNPDLIVMGLSGGQLLKAADDLGLRTVSEFFADRAYEESGDLVNRSKEGAVIHDEAVAIERVISTIKTGHVTAITGKSIPIKVDSICVHGDNIKAVAFVEKIRNELTKAGIQISPISENLI